MERRAHRIQPVAQIVTLRKNSLKAGPQSLNGRAEGLILALDAEALSEHLFLLSLLTLEVRAHTLCPGDRSLVLCLQLQCKRLCAC